MKVTMKITKTLGIGIIFGEDFIILKNITDIFTLYQNTQVN